MRSAVTRVAAGATALVLAAGAGAATYAVLDDGGAGGTTAAREASTATQPAKDGTLTIGQVYDRANASVVEITVTTQAAAAGPMGSGATQAQGSGFVYDTSGHVVTNAHVVEGASAVRVRFANGRTYDATVTGTDPHDRTRTILSLDNTIALDRINAGFDTIHLDTDKERTAARPGPGQRRPTRVPAA